MADRTRSSSRRLESANHHHHHRPSAVADCLSIASGSRRKNSVVGFFSCASQRPLILLIRFFGALNVRIIGSCLFCCTIRRNIPLCVRGLLNPNVLNSRFQIFDCRYLPTNQFHLLFCKQKKIVSIPFSIKFS